MVVFKINGYSENFIDNCFKTFLDNKHVIQEKVITVPKKITMIDKSSLHRNIRSARLYLYDRVQLRFAPLFGSSILGFFQLDFKLLRHQFLLKKMSPCLNEVETRSPRLLITGYSNSLMSCDDISIYHFLFFFLQSACDYSYYI